MRGRGANGRVDDGAAPVAAAVRRRRRWSDEAVWTKVREIGFPVLVQRGNLCVTSIMIAARQALERHGPISASNH